MASEASAGVEDPSLLVVGPCEESEGTKLRIKNPDTFNSSSSSNSNGLPKGNSGSEPNTPDTTREKKSFQDFEFSIG